MNSIAKGINATQLNKTLTYVPQYGQSLDNIALHVGLQLSNAASTLFLANLVFQADEMNAGHDYKGILIQVETLLDFSCQELSKITSHSNLAQQELKLVQSVKSTVTALIDDGARYIGEKNAMQILYGLEDTLEQLEKRMEKLEKLVPEKEYQPSKVMH